MGGTKEYDSKVWRKFGDKVGWRKGAQWLDYSELTLKEHYRGHLPYIVGYVGYWISERFGGFGYGERFRFGRDWKWVGGDGGGITILSFSRVETCRL